MQSSGRGGDCAFMPRKNGLVALVVFVGYRTVMDFWKRGFAQLLDSLFKLVIWSVEKEAYSAPPGSSIIYNFSDQGIVIAKIQFIADPDLAGRVYQNIPKPGFTV